jgi:hypothetical protein
MNYGDAPQPAFIQQGENREVLDSQLFQQLVQEAER